MSVNVLIVIPARGGSKGVPGKNMKILNSHPLLYYSIRNALYLSAQYRFDWVVSTDCPITHQYVQLFDPSICLSLRPSALSNDTATTASSLLGHLQLDQIIQNYQYFLLLQPTSPLIAKHDLDSFVMKFQDFTISHPNQNFSCASVRPVPHCFHPQMQLKTDMDGELLTPYGSSLSLRRQLLQPTFFRDGCLYITSLTTLLNQVMLENYFSPFHSDTRTPYVNIDTLDDFLRAKKYVRPSWYQ